MICYKYLIFIKFVPCGALTSKPFAFQYRPWELRTFEVNDIFDTFLTKLRFDFFNTNGNYRLTRVVPFVSGWITNKARFGYFDLFNSVKALPSLRLTDGKVDLTTPRFLKFISILKDYLSTIDFQTKIFCDNFVDINFQNKFKLFSQYQSNCIFCYNKSFTLSNFGLTHLVDLRSNFLLNEKFLINTEFRSSRSILILSGLNLRFELPLFNLRIKKLIGDGVIKVVGLGFVGDLGYSYLNTGVTRIASLNFLKGRHVLSNLLKSITFCYLFYGSRTSFCLKLLHFYWKSLRIFFTNTTFFEPIFLTNDLGFLQYLEIGGTCSISSAELNTNLSVLSLNIMLNPRLLSTNVLNFSLMNSVLNIAGSILPDLFEEVDLNFIDIVLPLDSVFETKQSYFLNIFGEYVGFNNIKSFVLGLNNDDSVSHDFIYPVFDLFNKKGKISSELCDYIPFLLNKSVIFSPFNKKFEVQAGMCFFSTNFTLSSIEFCNFYSDNILTDLKLNNFLN